MDLTQLGLMNGIASKMSWLVQRQGVIAENISNADTPGYLAKDISPFNFKNTMKRLMPTTTSSAHLSPVSLGGADDAQEAAERTGFEVKPDGNIVSREHEIMKASSTASDYQLVTNIYQKTVGMIKTAIGAN
jgi:flagellar basal-body rod protein FlgB